MKMLKYEFIFRSINLNRQPEDTIDAGNILRKGMFGIWTDST